MGGGLATHFRCGGVLAHRPPAAALICAALLLVTARCPAADPGTPPADRGAAFTLLGELGFPDVSGCKLGRLEAYGPMYRSPWSDRDKVGSFPIANAWLVAELTNGASLLIDMCGRRVCLRGRAAPLPQVPAVSNAIPVMGSWAPVPADKYLDALVRKLSSTPGKPDDEPDSTAAMALTMFLAAGAHQNGHHAQASQLVSIVGTNAVSPESIIKVAVNVLAFGACERALRELERGGEWGVFADEIGRLAALYGRQWTDYEAALETAEAARQRADGVLPGDIEPGGAEIDSALLRELVTDGQLQEQPLAEICSYPWILAPPVAEAAARSTSTTALARLLDGGMRSVPALLAVAGDKTPLPLAAHRLSRSHGGSDPAEAAARGVMNQRAYREFGYAGGGSRSMAPLPVTLGGLATSLLKAICPESGSVTEPAAAARALYAECRDLPRLELAFRYLRDGGYGQREIALSAVLQEGGTGVWERVESDILARSKEQASIDWLARSYAKRVPAARAAAFVDRLAAALRTPAPADGDTPPDAGLFVVPEHESFGRDGDVEQEIKSLRAALGREEGPAGIEAVLAEFLQKTADPGSSSAELSRRIHLALRTTPLDKSLPALVSAARKAPSARPRIALLTTFAWLPYVEEQQLDSGDDADAERVPPWRAAGGKREIAQPVVEKEMSPLLSVNNLREFWTEMIADTDSHGERSVRDAAAGVMERLYGEESDEARTLGLELGDRLQGLMLERAAARLAGTDLPPIPNAESMAGVDVSALQRDLLRTPTNALAAALEDMPLLALAALAGCADTNAVLMRHLAGPATRIRAVSEGLPLRAGARITTNHVTRLVQDARNGDMAPGRRIRVARDSLLRGVRVTVTNAPLEDTDNYYWEAAIASISGPDGPPEQGVVYARVTAPREDERWSRQFAIWEIAKPGAQAETQTPPAADDEDLDARIETRGFGVTRFGGWDDGSLNEERFWDMASQFCAATNMPLASAELVVHVVPPAAEDGEDAASVETLTIDWDEW